jgi:putative ATPase
MQDNSLWGEPVKSREIKKDHQSLLSIPKDAPLALRMAPRDFGEFVGQEEILGPGKALRKAIEGDRIPSMLFWGPPGVGKTALARLIATRTKSNFRELSAVTSGVSDVRSVVSEAEKLRLSGRRTILFIDEIHRFNKAQQDALLPHVEKGTVVLIGATTENPYFSVNQALLSRMRVFSFSPLSSEHIEKILDSAIKDKKRGLLAQNPYREGQTVPIEPEAKEHIVSFSKGDARVALNLLDALYNITEAATDPYQAVVLTKERVLEITQSPQLFYDKMGDQHYDLISAYIKSMRGSDPDAAVYWLARMLEAGEDPRFVARRLVICAAEDVGNADPMALVLAEAAFRASEHLGMPEARIPLAQATIYVALAPKSNSSLLAIDEAIKDVREKAAYLVPPHLRGTGYRGAKELGHGIGYFYPHDYPDHYYEQKYLPEELLDRRYYKPSKHEKESKRPGRNR